MTRAKSNPDNMIMARTAEVLARPDAAAVDLPAEYTLLAAEYRALLRKFHKTLVISDSYQQQFREMAARLEDSHKRYAQLKDIALPICMYCKKIRTGNEYWERLENFFAKHAEIFFSHGICPECVKTAFTRMGGDKRVLQEVLRSFPDARKPVSVPRVPVTDETIDSMKRVISSNASNPLVSELEKLVSRYAKLLRRFNKTVSISDSYQSQLMDLKTKLEYAARTDLLTGLANRWEMMARLDSEKGRSERHGGRFAMIIADIDHFKRINDSYGHLAGDRVLKMVSDTMGSLLRVEDVCGRWGGEEFMILLPETDLASAEVVAAKLLGSVESLRSEWEGNSIAVTMSMGVGSFSGDVSIDACIQVVDDALYAAKDSGRNRYETARA